MRKLILLGLLLCAPFLMAVGLGPGLFSSSGVLHPESGQDSFVCLGENSDWGTHRVCETIDATTDVLQDVDHWISPLGVSGKRFLESSVIHTSPTHTTLNELVRWYGHDNSSGHSAHVGQLAQDNGATSIDFRNGAVAIWSQAGGRPKLVSMGVRITQDMSTDTDDFECRLVAWKNENKAQMDFDSSAADPGTGWSQCTGSIDFGAQGTASYVANTGGVGEADGLVGDQGDYYAIPMAEGCVCAATYCKIVVAVQDRIADGCDRIIANFSAHVTEVSP